MHKQKAPPLIKREVKQTLKGTTNIKTISGPHEQGFTNYDCETIQNQLNKNGRNDKENHS